jgi:hypothetical protein
VAKLRSALVNKVTEVDMHDIAEALTVQAKRGNLGAIKLLFHYVLGKPTETVNPDTLDLEEWQQVVQPIIPIMKELSEAVVAPPIETIKDLVGTTGQAVEETLALPQQAFEKVINVIATHDPEGQESAEEEWRAASSEEEAPSTNGVEGAAEGAADPSTNGVGGPAEEAASPSTNGEHEQAERLADPSTNGGWGRMSSLLWLTKIAATARLASERTRNRQHQGT